MEAWLLILKESKTLRNVILLALFFLLYFLPEDWKYIEIVYATILFLIAYFSTYIEKDSIWKGLFLSLCVTGIIIVVALTTISLFPAISTFNLIIVMGIAGFLCTYLID